MNHSNFVLIIIILYRFIHNVKAQTEQQNDVGDLHPLHPTLALVIGIFAVVFSLTFLLLAYARFCKGNSVHENRNDQNFNGFIRSRSRFSGIDRTIVESLPFFRFSSLKGAKNGLECSICISKFEDIEVLRLLPKCRHAFHISCIDRWLESHSTCPICRYKFNLIDVKSVSYRRSNSSSSSFFRLSRNPSDLRDDPNVDIFVQREGENCHKKYELVIDDERVGVTKNLHRFKHKIIISDVVVKNRWSDVDSSDLMVLNSEMLSVLSSKRFNSLESKNTAWAHGNVTSRTLDRDVVKIKEDIERKRTYEAKLDNFVTSWTIPSSSNNDGNSSKTLLNRDEKRSMSEITHVSRFEEVSVKSKSKKLCDVVDGNIGKDERIRRVWFPIARRTVQWLASRESMSMKEIENKDEKLEV